MVYGTTVVADCDSCGAVDASCAILEREEFSGVKNVLCVCVSGTNCAARNAAYGFKEKADAFGVRMAAHGFQFSAQALRDARLADVPSFGVEAGNNVRA